MNADFFKAPLNLDTNTTWKGVNTNFYDIKIISTVIITINCQMHRKNAITDIQYLHTTMYHEQNTNRTKNFHKFSSSELAYVLWCI